ncbi:MAG: prolyl oligopeptidase family serine peptidase [Bacteroidetes bacterium]|nr:prolyl oligopeptidase family serine peptidase [Bacteroidota bacterium]
MISNQLVEFNDGKNILFGMWGMPDVLQENFPLVILMTGDGPSGSKGQTWQQIVPMLHKIGLGTFLFDFSGLGNSPGVYKELNLSLGCENFKGVMNFVLNNGLHDKNRIGILGASYGGNIALLEASKFSEIKAIALKSPSTFLPEGYQLQYGAKIMEEWGNEGYSKEVGLNYSAVLDSLFHNTYLEASKIECPVQIVHGTADSAVPIRHVRDLKRILKNGNLFEVQDADHWYANGNEWQIMAEKLVFFLNETL